MIKTKKENLVFSNKFFKIYNDDVEFSGGFLGTHLKTFALPTDQQIAILPFDSYFNVIIQDEYRYAIKDYITQCVMGGVKENQTFKEAAAMEMEEELSLFSDTIISIGSFITEPGIMQSKKEAFLAFNCKEKDNSLEKEVSESFINKRKIPFSTLLSMVNNGEIHCATTQMLVLRAAFIIDKMK